MVRVYKLAVSEEVPLSQLQSLSAGELLKKIANDGNEYVLTVGGRRIEETTPLSSLKLVEDSCLRLCQITSSASQSSPDENKLKECKRIFKRLAHHYHSYEMVALTEAVSDIGFGEKMAAKHPSLADQPNVLQILSDYFLMEAIFTAPDNNTEASSFLQSNPVFIDAVFSLLQSVQTNIPQGLMPRRRHLPENSNQHRQAGPAMPAAPQLFSQDFIAQAIQTAMARQNLAAVSDSSPAPAAVPVAQQTPEQRFAIQLGQLAEYGFTDQATNIYVLESVDGNVESALELLIVMRESEQ